MASPLPGTPLVWSPQSAADTLDASTSIQGAMASMSNLIPDPSTKNLWQCRPAAVFVVDLAAHGFTGATFISCWMAAGTRIYGMVSTTGTPAHDQPFCYDTRTFQFLPIPGTTTANTPISQVATGPWTPPHMELVGSKIIVTHPGFTGVGGAYFGVIDVSDPFHMNWTATNTSPVPLFFPPTWVSNFNGRAYYLVNPPGGVQPAAYFSDILNPTVITNADQILTFEDNEMLTCSEGLALSNQLGGIIQSLMVFKGVNNVYQITGDYSLGTLARNSLNVATGTNAPNSVCRSEKGLFFMSPEGIRIIDFNAIISDPIGDDGVGISVPFIYALNPSRTCAAFNGGTYRIQVENGNLVPPGSPWSSGWGGTGAPGSVGPAYGPSGVEGFSRQQEWWFDAIHNRWSGPHTTNCSLELAYQNSFFVTIQGQGARIFKSEHFQTISSLFTEPAGLPTGATPAGVQMNYVWATSMLPDTDQMAEIAMIQTTLHMQLMAGNMVTFQARDQTGRNLDTVEITGSGTPTMWNDFNWNQAQWNGIAMNNSLYPRRMAWHFPIVFRRLQLIAFGQSAAPLKIGRLHMRYQVLNYLQQAV